MDWQGIGLTDDVATWLDETGRAAATRERRLDPFATSMRDFDDVTVHLGNIEKGIVVQHSDATQRVADLRSTGLIETPANGAPKLTNLGAAALEGWRKWQVANNNPLDELARTLIVYGDAHRLSASPYDSFFKYWGELRAVFAPEELIDNWDALFTLNYLDRRIDGFAPGDAYRDDHTPVADVRYDLDAFAAAAGFGPRAIKGAGQVGRGITGKVPRGRARATAAIAMEILMRGPSDRGAVLARFGVPRRPRQWTALDAARIQKLLDIAVSFDVPVVAKPAGAAPPVLAPPPIVAAPAIVEPDYAGALQPAPQPKAAKKGGKTKGGAKKIDHRRRQERNSEVGSLGEEFVLGWERWRLRNYPALAKNVSQVSLNDDTLGYDIVSYEIDGTKRLVEVKTTEGPLSTRFFLSANELECASSNPSTYVIVRVSNIRIKPTLCELRHPFDELEMKPAVFESSFKRATPNP